MKEIRLYRMRLISLTLGETWDGGNWIEDTLENRQNYEELQRVGVQKFGKGTHWIEERTVKKSLPAHANAQLMAALKST